MGSPADADIGKYVSTTEDAKAVPVTQDDTQTEQPVVSSEKGQADGTTELRTI
jgi:hypothetical protein